MARRMEVELTSNRDDGTWTWRAVGAREPRGVVPEKVLPSGSSVGDVLRVEADFELDGITITSVLPPKAKSDRAGTIEIAARPVVGAVTTSLVGRGARTGRPDGDRGRPDGPSRASAPRRDGTRRDGSRPDGARAERHAAGAPTAHDGDRRPSPTRARPRPAGSRDAAGRPAAPKDGEALPRDAAASRGPSSSSAARRGAPTDPAGARHTKGRPQRLIPGTAHRDAYLAGLPADQRPIAEQLALGGLPAVRRALEVARAAARAEGREHEPGQAMLTLAEQLLPAVREAVWLDRAEATVEKLDSVSLRDLRAAVVGGAPREDGGRALLQRLREALDERVAKLRGAWETDVARSLDDGRVLQALRLSARPPEPTARFPAALVTRLADAAGNAMSASAPPERWLAILEAAAASPIRRSIKPTGLPEDASGAVRRAAQADAGRIPALARLLGLAMPPPPRPLPPPPRQVPGAPPAVASARSSEPAPPVPLPGGTVEAEVVPASREAGVGESFPPARASDADPSRAEDPGRVLEGSDATTRGS